MTGKPQPHRQRARLPMLGSRVGQADLRSAQPSAKKAAPFYQSSEWRALIAAIIKKRGRRCEEHGCGREGCRVYGDHIKELQDGGDALDERNVMLLCGSCHGKKTARERNARMARDHSALS